MSLQESVKIGKFAILAFPPGVHGATKTGMQGIGVKVPIAAAVAEATCGLDIDLHIPKEAIFSIGVKSIIFPICIFPMVGRKGSIITKLVGEAPKEHSNVAPLHTGFAIHLDYYLLFLGKRNSVTFLTTLEKLLSTSVDFSFFSSLSSGSCSSATVEDDFIGGVPNSPLGPFK